MTSASFRYFGSGMSAPFHLLSNFNECRITGRVFVRDDESDDQPEQQGGAAPPSQGDEAEAGATPANIVEREFVFPSAEHYWWAHFTQNVADVSRLAVGGDLSTLEGGLCLLLGARRGAQKANHWRKKDNVGIVAKMVAAGNAITTKAKSSAPSCATGAGQPSDNDVYSRRARAKNLGMELGLHPLPQYGGQGEMATLRRIWSKIQRDKFAQNPEHRRVLASTGTETLVEFVRMRPDGHTWGGQVRGGVKRPKGLTVGGELVGGNFTGECLMEVRASL